MSVSCNKAVNLARIFPVCSDIVISVHYICHINNQRHKIMKSRLWLSVCLLLAAGTVLGGCQAPVKEKGRCGSLSGEYDTSNDACCGNRCVGDGA